MSTEQTVRTGQLAGGGALVAAALSCAFAAACQGAGDEQSSRPVSDPGLPEALASRSHAEHLARGGELYLAHCASCHGERGAGDGELSTFLFPPPRDFADGRFKLVSSTNGAPFDRDIVAMLQRGMPGSAMPAFGWLPEEDLWSLAAAVREIATDGLALRLTSDVRAGDVVPLEEAEEEALQVAQERMTPSAAIAVPPRGKVTAAVAERGELLYRQRCAVCHGMTGEGRPTAPRADEDGTLNWARDFTAGFVKGGATYADLVYRIQGGMPGTAMPANDLEPDDLAALAEHVRAMIPAGTENALVQSRGNLFARRVDELPADPDDDAWDAAVQLKIVLAPLAWVDEAVPAASVSALHDGERIAVKVAWHDRTNDSGQAFEAGLADACAVQFSSGATTPLSGMGTSLNPTTIWHWRAAWPEDFADVLVANRPHGRAADLEDGAVLDVPIYRPALPQASQEARGMEATGPGRLEDTAGSAPLPRARARWSDDSWRVVFTRELDAEGDDLVPGGSVNLALAIWNGAAGDYGARKALSIWQALELAE